MEDDTRLLSRSFGSAATAYAEHRPDYAQAAVRWALEPAPGRRVLDLGAGTGKLTAVLLALGVEVVAVEPDPAMLVELRTSLPTARALLGSAESIPLPDQSVDAVLAGHAMHWFDMRHAGPEIARVLTPGGVLAGLWNVYDDEVEWVADLARVGGAAAIGERDLRSTWRAVTANLHLPTDNSPPCFDSPQRAEFPHRRTYDADSLTAMLATRAGMLMMPESERGPALARIRAFLEETPETNAGNFDLQMLTGVLRGRRSGRAPSSGFHC